MAEIADIADISPTVEAHTDHVVKDLRLCPGCGRPETRWREHAGAGFQLGHEVYCCRGCADETGCTCGR